MVGRDGPVVMRERKGFVRVEQVRTLVGVPCRAYDALCSWVVSRR